MKWYISGDTHGQFTRFEPFIKMDSEEPIGIIILGDAGFNFYLNKTDWRNKRNTAIYNVTFYCVRGNHEERPENISSMIKIYDEEVQGPVYMEPEFPHIKYFCDGAEYRFNGARALVLGGAYSIDKWYRLGALPEDTTSWTGWFKDEQLTKQEMENIDFLYCGEHFDLILAHTCPLSYQPRELFLSFINQDTVDNTMEKWMEHFVEQVEFKQFLFGHYHADKIINEKARMFYKDIVELERII